MKIKYLWIPVIAALCMALPACSEDEPEILPAEFKIPSGCVPDIAQDQIVVISDNATLGKVFDENIGRLPAVDFKNCSLMLVTGVSNYGIRDIAPIITKSETGYTLDITVSQTFATVMQPWTIGYRIPKDTEADDIGLTISYIL